MAEQADQREAGSGTGSAPVLRPVNGTRAAPAADSRERVLLIDGHALVYRAFYALQAERPLTSPKGELTTGVYGFTSMLLKALDQLKPQYVVAAFDLSAPTFRSDQFQAYKATRQAAPEGLHSQVELSQRVLQAMGVPIYHVPGYEADDIIGTLTCQASAQDLDVVVLSGDNDLLQLVGPRVALLTSRRGISDTVLYDVQAVHEKYGLRPEQIADFKALRGDASDNIPGVPGIGEKTAQKLLQEHQTVEQLYAHLDTLPEKQRLLLARHAEQVILAKRLATVVCDLPVELDLEQARLAAVHRPEVVGLFHELGFKSLMDRLPKPAPAAAPEQGALDLFGGSEEAPGRDEQARAVDTLEALDGFLERARARGGLAFNVQATGTLPMSAEIVGIGLAAGEEAVYVPVGHVAGGQLALGVVLERVRGIFADAGVQKRAHNAKFHMILLGRQGVRVEGLAFDTMIAAYLLESGQRALALRDLAWAKLQVELPSVASLLGTGKKAVTMAQLAIGECAAYACQEARLVERLSAVLERELEEAGQTGLFRQVELPLVPVLAAMEGAGIAVDQQHLAELGREMHRRLGELESEIYRWVGHEFNVNSTQQLSQVLFQELHLETKTRRARTKAGHLPTGVEVLEELRHAHPVVALILEHRQLQKLKSTYVDALLALVNPHTGRVHTSFNQTVAATGRLSSSDPNLQNIPVRTEIGRRVRRAFVARPGACFLSADYSQLELRILAHMADDPTLLEAFAQGEDPHAATAAEVLGVDIRQVTQDERRIAKTVNYGVLYGMSDFGLADRLGLAGAQASAFIQRYFDRFSTVKEFQERVIREVTRRGYAETLLSRRRYFPEIKSSIYAVRQAAIRAAINAPIQGTASDIVKIAMIDVQAFLEREAPEVKMLLQVHDELLLEGPEAELLSIAPEIARRMEGAMELRAKLRVDLKLGENWEEMRPIGLDARAGATARA